MKTKAKIWIKEMRKQYGKLMDAIELINKNDELSDIGKKKARENAIDEFTKNRDYYMEQLKEVFESKSERKPVNTNSLEYQIGLSNAIKILELCVPTIDRTSFIKLVEPYVNDSLAASALNAVIANSRREDLPAISSETFRTVEQEEAYKLINSIQEQLNTIESADYDLNQFTGLGNQVAFNKDFFLTGALDYLEAHFDDNLA